jgi:hypothetical protein
MIYTSFKKLFHQFGETPLASADWGGRVLCFDPCYPRLDSRHRHWLCVLAKIQVPNTIPDTSASPAQVKAPQKFQDYPSISIHLHTLFICVKLSAVSQLAAARGAVSCCSAHTLLRQLCVVSLLATTRGAVNCCSAHTLLRQLCVVSLLATTRGASDSCLGSPHRNRARLLAAKLFKICCPAPAQMAWVLAVLS